MRDRASFFFANISKCESGCTYQGIDFSLHKFKCECKFKSFSDDNTGDTKVDSKNEFPKKKSSSNMGVFKCLKDVFKSKYFKKCAGAYHHVNIICCSNRMYGILFCERYSKNKKTLFFII